MLFAGRASNRWLVILSVVGSLISMIFIRPVMINVVFYMTSFQVLNLSETTSVLFASAIKRTVVL